MRQRANFSAMPSSRMPASPSLSTVHSRFGRFIKDSWDKKRMGRTMPRGRN